MSIDDKSGNGSAEGNSGKQSFFSNLFANLFKSASPELEKKRKLKAIAKDFSKTKFHNFYKPSSIEAMPPMAKMFYDIYKIISPAQILFKSNPNPGLFKNHIINYSLSENQITLLEHFSEQKILEMSKQMPMENIVAQIENDLETFSSGFDADRINRAENLYKAFVAFRDFCNFDYYKILKKFTNGIQEHSFSTQPVFEKINSEYIVDDLADFCTVAYAITDDSILWNSLFEFFKATRSTEIVSAGNWKKIVARAKAIQSSHAFEMIYRHTTGKFKYVTEVESNYESLIEPYLDTVEKETRKILDKFQYMQQESKSNQLCMQIFGATGFQNLHNYTSNANDTFLKKDLDSFEYAKPLNFLKTFLLEYVKKDIREYYEVVVIRGQWDSSLSAPMSNAYQELLKCSDEITAFDNELSEEGALGIKIKTLLPKTAHDAGAEQIINRVISDSNDRAKSYLITSTQNLITIGKVLKQLIEDYMKQKPVIVHNWKELERYMDAPIKDFSVNLYKKIYLFVQLMQQYLSNQE